MSLERKGFIGFGNKFRFDVKVNGKLLQDLSCGRIGWDVGVF